MKTILRYISIILFSFMLSDCQMKLIGNPRLDCEETIEVTYAKGSYSVPYKLTEAFDHVLLKVFSEDDWITDIKVKDSTIEFCVEENTSESRTGVLTLRYPGISKTMLVSQKSDPRNFNTIEVNGTSFTMVGVSGGSFTMGATSEQGGDIWLTEQPAHPVTLTDYYIGQTEVTQELWKAVMGADPSFYTGNPKLPVERVSWNDIVNDFLPKLNSLTGMNFTLPTEAQWEFAARGGNKGQGYKYSGSNKLDEVAWYYCENPNPVGQKMPNEHGFYDMSGNVCEWCSDWYGDYSAEAQVDPTGAKTGERHVLRGGSYKDYPRTCRVSARSSGDNDGRNHDFGFRLALTVAISLNKESLRLAEGQSSTLVAYSNGTIPLDSGLTWSSSDPSIASVDSDGKVSAQRAGSCVITVRLNGISKSASCKLNVISTEPSMVVTARGVEIPLIKVEGGTFTMGATPEQGNDAEDSEKPAHQVTVPDYYIGQTEVTQELWEAVMGINPSMHKGNPKNPVEKISWNDIVHQFLPKLNALTGKTFTLPTEAQWEFAARGGNKSLHYKYSGSNDIDETAWYIDNAFSTPHPVGQKLPNELGIYDMSGNVSEWCSDSFVDYSPEAEAQRKPTGTATGDYRVSRGGGYNINARGCRVSYRLYNYPSYIFGYCGFRLALAL